MRPLDTLFTANHQLVFQMDVAGGQKRVDAVQWCMFDGFIASVNVSLNGSRQATNSHRLPRGTSLDKRTHFACNDFDRFKISFGSDREPGLANVHSKT
mmetsp:Transcript_47849/g.80368  ORF Transcript_47849/g.80368 Transcript_47849/m.80368 type:complete len:98 (-) Transcript_47849:215-508(-)